MSLEESVTTGPEEGAGRPPFDASRLDRLMDQHGLDAVLVTSKHNIQYLLGGYRYFFYSYMDAHGLSRYLPTFVYVRERADLAAYVASPMETFERDLGKFWVGEVLPDNMTSPQYAATAAAYLRRVARDNEERGVLRQRVEQVLG